MGIEKEVAFFPNEILFGYLTVEIWEIPLLNNWPKLKYHIAGTILNKLYWEVICSAQDYFNSWVQDVFQK